MRNTLSLLVTDSLYILIKNGRLLRLVGRVLISHLYHAPIAQTKDLPISADRANLSGKIAFPIRTATGALCFVIRRYRPAPLKCGDTCSYNNTRLGRPSRVTVPFSIISLSSSIFKEKRPRFFRGCFYILHLIDGIRKISLLPISIKQKRRIRNVSKA